MYEPASPPTSVPAISARVWGHGIAPWVANTTLAAKPLRLETKFLATLAER